MSSYYSVGKKTGVRSSVIGYEYGIGFIIVQFNDGYQYTYTYDSCDVDHVEAMKILADAQEGLNGYINRYRPIYASKKLIELK